MTDQGDALIALRGVLSVLNETMETQFIFGLPEAYLDESLLWVIREPHDRRQALSNDMRRLPFPSWTWAGWETPSCYRGNFVGAIRPEVQWFLVTQTGDVTSPICCPAWQSSWESFRELEHQNISPDYSNCNFKALNLRPRSHIKPEDAEVASLACQSSIATFQFSGEIVEEDNNDWPEHKNFAISDSKNRIVGAIWMESKWSNEIKTRIQFEFMLLSRSQAVEFMPKLDESIFPLIDWSYVNVMLIERQGSVVERLGIGVLHENAWVAANPSALMLYLR